MWLFDPAFVSFHTNTEIKGPIYITKITVIPGFGLSYLYYLLPHIHIHTHTHSHPWLLPCSGVFIFLLNTGSLLEFVPPSDAAAAAAATTTASI